MDGYRTKRAIVDEATEWAKNRCWCGGKVGLREPGDENGLGCLDDIYHDWKTPMLPMFDAEGNYVRSEGHVDRGTVLMVDTRTPISKGDLMAGDVPIRTFHLRKMAAGDWEALVYCEKGFDDDDPHTIGNVFRWLTRRP